VSKLTVRPATPDDIPAIRRCHSQIEMVPGKSLDLPEVDGPAVLEAFVVEENGEVVGGVFLEKSVRLSFVGASPEAMSALKEVQAQVFATSKEAGVRFMHCPVATAISSADDISRHLQECGFDRRDDLAEHVLDLQRLKGQHGRSIRIEADEPAEPKWLM
jgi:hypothetical protein